MGRRREGDRRRTVWRRRRRPAIWRPLGGRGRRLKRRSAPRAGGHESERPTHDMANVNGLADRERARERGDGYVFRRPGSRFYAYRFYLDRQPHKGSTHETDEAKAWRVLDRKREAAKCGDEVPGEDRLRVRDLGMIL